MSKGKPRIKPIFLLRLFLITKYLADYRKQLVEVLVVPAQFVFDLGKFLDKFFVEADELPDADKGSHYRDVDKSRPFAFKNRRQHGYTLFGEGIRQVSLSASV